MDNIKVTSTCGRCGHKDEKSVSLDEIIKLEEKRKNRDETAEKLEGLADSLSTALPEPPQVAVFMLNSETQKYDLHMLYDLCDRVGKEDGKRRGCVARVKDLLTDLCNVQDLTTGEKKARKPRGKKAKEVETSEEIGTSEETVTGTED